NKQAVLQEIWVATKFKGDHCVLDNDRRIDECRGVELWQLLSKAVRIQAETELTLSAQ
ncbi:frataxin-like protein, partial [Marinomonas sp. SBI22]